MKCLRCNFDRVYLNVKFDSVFKQQMLQLRVIAFVSKMYINTIFSNSTTPSSLYKASSHIHLSLFSCCCCCCYYTIVCRGPSGLTADTGVKTPENRTGPPQSYTYIHFMILKANSRSRCRGVDPTHTYWKHAPRSACACERVVGQAG